MPPPGHLPVSAPRWRFQQPAKSKERRTFSARGGADSVRQAYAEGLVDPSFADLESVEHELASPARPLRGYDLITDAISEMKWWGCFDRSGSETTKLPAKLPGLISPQVPATAPSTVRVAKVGRNQPCPCGSGKKYKKCCGKSQIADRDPEAPDT